MDLPSSMDGLDYFTNRRMNAQYEIAKGAGRITAWIKTPACEHCKEPLTLPKDSENHPRYRAQIRTCKNKHAIGLHQYLDLRKTQIVYQCPFCAYQDVTSLPGKWIRYSKAWAMIFSCENCRKDIPITNRLSTWSDKNIELQEAAEPIRCPKCRSEDIDYENAEDRFLLKCYSCKFEEKKGPCD